jgi:hypothetical protein
VIRDLRDRETKCTYCGRTGHDEVAALDIVIAHIDNTLALDFEIPENELLYDRESESGWGGTVYDAYEVLEHVGFDVRNAQLLADIASAFSDRQFCNRDYGLMRPTERRVFGWERFKSHLKHERRYTFWDLGDPDNDPDHPDYLGVGQMLKEIGLQVRDASLALTVRIGEQYWRARVHKPEQVVSSDRDIAPPKPREAKYSNRMSPAGIVMFYRAESDATALSEVTESHDDVTAMVSVGQFEITRQLRLLDLASIPDKPSYFDLDARTRRIAIAFLNHFARDIAAPVKRDGTEHIEYVPTQAFTEYVRFQLKDTDGSGFDGIRYRSAITGGGCVVLFCGQDACTVDAAPGAAIWMQLVPGSLYTKRVGDVPPPVQEQLRNPRAAPTLFGPREHSA